VADLDGEQQQYANEIKFVRQEPRLVYQGTYTDPAHNIWTLDVVGTEEAVNEFIKPGTIFLHAQPLLRDVEGQIEEVRSPAEAEQAAAEAMAAGYQSSRQLGEEGDLGEQPFARPEEGLPELEVIISLRELAISRPYRAHFVIDPSISSGYRKHEFRLSAGDAKANVSYKAEEGAIKVKLAGPGGEREEGPSAEGSLAVVAVSSGTSWTVTVTHAWGTPATYTLSGDIDVA
jgi:hypothetical protein